MRNAILLVVVLGGLAQGVGGQVCAAAQLMKAESERSASRDGAEAGMPWMEVYDADTYSSWRGAVKVGHSQNWSIAQGGDGTMYVANQEGVLRYDGERWTAVPVGASAATGRRSKRVLSVAALPEGHPNAGRILVAGDGTFGVLRTDSLGRKAYVALSARRPAMDRDLGTVWKTSATSRAGYFLTDDRFVQWRADSLRAWTPTDLTVPPGVDTTAFAAPDARRFFFSFVVRDTAYVQIRGVGLLRVDGDRLQVVSADARLASDGIYAVMPYGDDQLLIGTRNEGLLLYDGTAVRAFDAAVTPWLHEHQLYHGRRLPDGTYAFATRQGGVLRMSAEGRRLQVWNESGGLPDDKVHFATVDADGALWLALNDGVARIDLESPYRYYGASLGLPDQPSVIERHRGTLYVGTTSGVYRLQTREGGAPRFVPIPAFDQQCTDLVSTPQGLLVVTQERVAVWTTGTAYAVHDDNATTPRVALWSQASPSHAYVGYTSGGLRRLRAEGGRWRLDATLADAARPVSELAEARDGTLWATGADGATRVGRPSSRAPTTTHYGLNDGLPVLLDLNVFAVDGRLYFGTRQGLHRFDAARAAFVRDSTFGADWASPSTYVTHLRPHGADTVWARAANLTRQSDQAVIAPLYRSDSATWKRGRPLSHLRTTVVRGMHVEDGALWMGVGEPAALVRRALPPRGSGAASGRPSAPQPLLRRVTVGPRDSLVYGGSGAPPLRLPPASNDVQIAVAAPSFSHAQPVQYRARQAGEAWSSWTDAPTARFDNLPPGSHRLQVQARIVGGAPSEPATVALTIRAPWYRTGWAFLLWGLLGLGGVVGGAALAVRWRTRRLKARQTQLQEQVATQTARLREEKERTAEALETVAEQRDAITTLHDAQSELFANVSHEFRTPLTVALGLLEEWVDAPDDALPDAARQDLQQVLLNNRRLLRLINQLLDIARLESDTLDLQVQWVDVGAFVETVALAFVGLAERRQIEFRRRGLDATVYVPADPDKLETVVANLLSNAFKYTPEGGRVTLNLSVDETAAVLHVDDTGPGIPEDEHEAIFDRFHQSDDRTSSVGTGIGLALTEALVERHGGTIGVDSTPGDGATFTVRWPRSDEHLTDRPDVTWTAGDASPAASAVTAPPQPPPEPVRAGPSPLPSGDASPDAESPDRPTVLVVDDNADIRAFVRRHLASTYRVVEAADGADGLDRARDLTPDCIVADVMMPRMDGLELLDALRSDAATDFIPVVLLTARAALDDKMEGLDAGADDYLTKPFRPDELQARIRNLRAQRMRLRERFQSDESAPQEVSEDAAAPPFLREVEAAIRERVSDEDLTVGTLAEEVGVSRSKLYRELGAITDASPADLIWQVRLQKARTLLEDEAGNVSEVAYGVGFKSVSHFSRRFRDRFGVPPSSVQTGPADAKSS